MVAGDAHYHAIVIGAGIAGLSTAALLAARGLRVLLLEAHRAIGGNCVSWPRMVQVAGQRQRFIFDSGVQDISGLGPRGPVRNLLRQLGAEDRLQWHRVRHQYWRDGSLLEGALTPADFIGNLCSRHPQDAAGIRAFFDEIFAVYRDIYANVERTGGVPTPPSPCEMLVWPQCHPHAFRWMARPFDEMLSTYLGDGAAADCLRTVSEYITEDPHLLSVGDMAPLFGYYLDGGYYPEGGAQSLPDLLSVLFREHGGTLKCRTTVERILFADGQACGVVTITGQRFYAPLIISNADVVTTLTHMSDASRLPDTYAERITTLKRGPSAVLVSLALDTKLPLAARSFVQQDGLHFGIGNPSVLDDTLAPPGCSAVTLLCLLSEAEAQGWLKRDESYAVRKQAFTDRLIDAVAHSVFADIRKHIVYCETATPATFSRYTGAQGGNIYGAARGGWAPAPITPVPGLMLIGAGTQTGAGIEAVTVCATRAADRIRPPRAYSRLKINDVLTPPKAKLLLIR